MPTIDVHVSPTELDRLQTKAAELGTSVSSLLRGFLSQAYGCPISPEPPSNGAAHGADAIDKSHPSAGVTVASD